MIRAGRMDRKITLERATESKDSTGAPVQTWSPLGYEWAQKSDTSGSEAMRGSLQLTSSKITFFLIHYRAGLTPKDRIVCDGEVWNITFLREIGRRELLEITAEVVK